MLLRHTIYYLEVILTIQKNEKQCTDYNLYKNEYNKAVWIVVKDVIQG